MTLGQFSQPNRREKRQHGDKATVSAMTGDQAETTRVRERLTVLLSTYLTEIEHTSHRPELGDVVMEEGAKAERVLLVMAGQLSVEVKNAHGHPQIVAIVGTDDLVGEMGLVGNYRHTTTVRVSEGPAELLAMHADDLLKATLFDNELVMELLALSSERCQQSNHHSGLLIEGLEALHDGNTETLEQSCAPLATTAGVPRKAAQLLEQLAQQLLKPTKHGRQA